MYPQIFEIRLDDDTTKKFYAGQLVEGRVILALGKEKVVRGIVVRLIGKGNVYWDNTGIKHNTVYRESETYVNATAQLLVPEDGRQTVMAPGSYEYLFSLQLPPNIPSSIEGQHCFVRYYLEAAIQRPWKDDQIQESVIHVTSISDLSPETAEPASMQQEKFVGFNLCQKGPIILNFMIGKTGFVPGEFLQFGVEIRNTSSTRINRVHVSLKRQLTGHAKGETKSSHDKFLQLNGPPTEVGGYLLWQSNFEIPVLPPSDLLGCNIISIKYYVEIKLALEKWVDAKFVKHIFIGTSQQCVKEHRNSSSELFFANHETPTKKPKSRKTSVVMSRKNSMIKSPIEEFRFNDNDAIWGNDDEVENVAMLMSPPSASISGENGFIFSSSLPPLDLTFFQTKPERHPFFKFYEDCDYESSYPYRNMSTSNVPQQANRPPRPHSNPGHHWGRSYWDNEDD